MNKWIDRDIILFFLFAHTLTNWVLITTSSGAIHSLKGYISQYPTPSLRLKSRQFHLSTGDACDAEFLARAAGRSDKRRGG